MGFGANKLSRSAKNIRSLNAPPKLPPQTGAGAIKEALGTSPKANPKSADRDVPFAVVRELLNSGDPGDLIQLRGIVANLSPKAASNLQLNIARATRDPQFVDPTGKGKIDLTPEGKHIMAVLFEGADPDPSMLGKPATAASGVRLADIPIDADVGHGPMAPPVRPKLPEGSEPVRKRDQPRFVSDDESVSASSDGTVRVERTDPKDIDSQTRRAIQRAEKGERPIPIFDDAHNTPAWARNIGLSGNALSAGTRTPQQQLTELMHRLAGSVSPHGGVSDSVRTADPLMFDVADARVDNPSVFAPGNTGSRLTSHVDPVSPSDYGDAMLAFNNVRRGKARTPNEQFSSAEEFARAFVAGADQNGFNITPITAGQRAEATDLLQDSMYDPESAPVTYGRSLAGGSVPAGGLHPAQVGRLVRQEMPDAVDATKMAERSLMQEQAIAALTRKFESIFGDRGWGDDYQPSYRPDSGAPAAVGTPAGDLRPGTTQDVNAVPARVELGEEGGKSVFPNVRGEAASPSVRVAPGKPGFDVDPELTTDDLVEWHQLQQLDGEGPEIPDGAEENYLHPGRLYGDKLGVTPSKPRKDTGHIKGAYQDETPFAQYNRENPGTTDGELKKRAQFAEVWRKSVGGETERTSVLERALREELELAEPMTPARKQRIAALKERLKFARLLDMRSGVRSLEVPQ